MAQKTTLATANEQLRQEIAKRQQVEAALQQQTEWARLTMAMQARIGQRFNLEEVLNTTVAEARKFLGADRVVVYKLEPNGMANAIAESVDPACISVVGMEINAALLQKEVVSYCQGNPSVIHNTQLIDPTASDRFLQHQQVKASLTVPILYRSGGKAIDPPLLWGLLAIHQCCKARFWPQIEVELLQQLATQFSVAIGQSQLYQQVVQLTTNLESQVQQQTAQLQKFLDFEATLKRISDDVRDTLDEKQILQTAVWELAVVLNTHCCNTGLYDAQLATSTIAYEYTQNIDTVQGQVIQMQDFPEGYQQLLQGQHFQFCELGSQWRAPLAMLACPICDDRGTIGDLWLFKQLEAGFDDLEIRLVQQVANQCAIAIRQARLFQSAQAKIQELETLNRYKDDFLGTVFHELRTPLANMKMAIQMLGTILLRDRSALAQPKQLEVISTKVNRYLQILHNECDRELNLINKLLDLQISGNAQPLVLTAIQLQDWLPQFVEPFQVRSSNYKQSLLLDIPPDLPRLICEPSSLSRIMAELLNNACKYTPAGEKILVRAKVLQAWDAASVPMMQIDVSNWGVEIPASEIPRIFEKFYRIRAHDVWNQGGTGLGLALVEQLVTRLGGKISVESLARQTCFIVKLPLS
jgi:signal transduction histidine kinase